MNAERLRGLRDQLGRAVQRLAEALARPKDEFIRDAAIQRFEFTFELTWKTLKVYLELQGLEARSPRAAIREAFAVGLLADEDAWLRILALRNLTTHTYDEAVAEQVYGGLAEVLECLMGLLARLDEDIAEL